MKKLFKLLAFFLISSIMFFSLTSCSNDIDDDDSTGDSTNIFVYEGYDYEPESGTQYTDKNVITFRNDGTFETVFSYRIWYAGEPVSETSNVFSKGTYIIEKGNFTNGTINMKETYKLLGTSAPTTFTIKITDGELKYHTLSYHKQ